MPAKVLDDAVTALLARSLEAWRIVGTVEQGADGALLVRTARQQLRVARAPAGLPFRWVVEEAGRTRGAASVSGLLRHVRAAVDPGWRPVRLRITSLPP
jgi:hypothetical protein